MLIVAGILVGFFVLLSGLVLLNHADYWTGRKIEPDQVLPELLDFKAPGIPHARISFSWGVPRKKITFVKSSVRRTFALFTKISDPPGKTALLHECDRMGLEVFTNDVGITHIIGANDMTAIEQLVKALMVNSMDASWDTTLRIHLFDSSRKKRRKSEFKLAGLKHLDDQTRKMN